MRGLPFSRFSHSNYEVEIKRHNLAIEKLQKSKELWYENQVKNKERIERLRMELNDATDDINRTNMMVVNTTKNHNYLVFINLVMK